MRIIIGISETISDTIATSVLFCFLIKELIFTKVYVKKMH